MAKKTKIWTKRIRKTVMETPPIGRMVTIHPLSGDLFYLRLLLKKVSAPKSFANLRTVDGEEHSTFKSACMARGLLQDDSHWKNCLTEACKIAIPKVIRNLFCTMLIHCVPTKPKDLFEKFKSCMSEDFRKSRKQ